MKIRCYLLVFIVLVGFCYLSADDTRDMGYGVSEPVYIYTGGAPNGGMSTGYSNALFIQTQLGQIASGISGSISIDTQQAAYSEFRIVTVSQAPNPDVLMIPEGGSGFAWFVLEGKINGVWLPAESSNLIAQDAQGNLIGCQTGLLPFQFLSNAIHMQNAGVFGVSIPSSMIGNGTPGSTETITVTTVNGQSIAPQYRQSVSCEVVPYQYTEEWGYRLYAKGGAGATAGIVTALGFGGGGSGTTIALDLQGSGSNPVCTAFKIKRRDDVFVGTELELKPTPLIDVVEGSVEVQASLPYEIEYDFDLDDLDGLESLMAFYLITEPTVLYATSTNLAAQLSARFLSLCFQLLVANNAVNGLGISRVSDEVGLDIQGSVDLSTNFLAAAPLGLKMGPGLGASAHLGGSLKYWQSGAAQTRLFLGGEYKTTANIGPKLVSDIGISSKFFYPHRFNSSIFPATRNVEYEMLSKWNSLLDWESMTFSSKIGSSSPSFQMFNLPGQMQEHKTWLKIEDTAIKNYCLNSLYAPVRLWNIGSSAVNMVTSNETFSQDLTNLLGTVYQQQNSNLPVKLKYGFEIEDKSAFEFGIDLSFPLPNPIFPPLAVKLGTGLQATNSRTYHIADGYWVKGYPYFQNQMPNPPTNDIEITNVIATLWNGLTQGNLFSELGDLILAEIAHKVLSWSPWRTEMAEILNPNGSYITLTESSFPDDSESAVFRFWNWGEEPLDGRLNQRQRDTVKRYNQQFRHIREQSTGMHYGIGGFYQFEAPSAAWNEAPVLTIKYLDSELDGIDETTLKMYWEDEQGGWHMLNSVAVPDSNLVRAAIPYFTTYTLAPNLPNGVIGLSATPDSLMADGFATAQVSSATLYHNDGSIVADGTQYTVQTNRGQFLTADVNPLLSGLQIAASGGSLQFTVQADSIPVPIVITVSSVAGYAAGTISLPLYAAAPPAPPTILNLQAEHRTLHVSWQELTEPGIVGYKIYFDTDSPGPPYNGTSSQETQNSPVLVGNIGQHTLTGLDNAHTYYIAITALDASGNESPLSNEMTAQPVLNAATNVNINTAATGIRISWTPSYGATSYKVFRSPYPQRDPAQMEFLGETTDAWWIDPSASTSNHNFYTIISIGY